MLVGGFAVMMTATQHNTEINNESKLFSFRARMAGNL
jgi:hypothetical protein